MAAAGSRELVIANDALGFNYPDALMVPGKYQKRPEPPFVPGRDCAGTMLAVGEGVTDFKVGDPVLAQVFSGDFAEQVAAPVERVFHRPAGISAIAAAAATTVFNTVFVAVSIRSDVKADDRVVVMGAAGSVGAAAVQLATNLGAHVVGIVSSEEKEELVRCSDAKAIVIAAHDGSKMDASQTQVRRAWGDDREADVVIDTAGGAMFRGGLLGLGFAGKLVIVGFASGDIPAAKANYLLYDNQTVMGAPLNIYFDEALKRMRDGANVAAVLPFDGLMHRLQDIVDRKVTGKLAVKTGTAI
ncbi:zinc-binding dehydrogenase [Mesorhizobium sp. M0933]|uniref:zinc-binding dehydrogenase n=1 Tax=Mesorhizobium sp. M0933 TaxID=2957030 RepID=UPI003335A1B5